MGSSDLWRVMEEVDDAKDYRRAKSMKEADKEAKAATNHMQEVAERRLPQFLLDRFLLLNLLVEEAQALPGGLREKKHSRLWVLLQGLPHIFSGDFESDIFTDLTRLLPETFSARSPPASSASPRHWQTAAPVRTESRMIQP